MGVTLKANEIATYYLKNCNRPQISIRNLIREAFEDLLPDVVLSELEMADYVYDMEQGVYNCLFRFKNGLLADGKMLPFDFGIDNRTLIKYDLELREPKIIFIKWLNEMSSVTFEALCCKILELEGCVKIVLTRPSKDGGIDFYGEKEIEVDETGSIGGFFYEVRVVVVGQAKRYSSPIGIGHIREFLGSVDMMRISNLDNAPRSLSKTITSERYKPYGPFVLTFITTCKFTRDTLALVDWLGVRVIDGEKIFELFYRHGCGFVRSDNGIVFEPTMTGVI